MIRKIEKKSTLLSAIFKKKLTAWLVTLLCISLIPTVIPVVTIAPASSVTWYVATTGSDAAAGDINHPFRTIQHAVDVAQAGHTIYIRGGTYYQQIWMKRSGTSGSPITLAGYPGETAIIDGSGVNVGENSLVMLGRSGGAQYSYITFKDLTIQDSAHTGLGTAWGTYAKPSSHITISYCKFYNIKYNAIYFWQEDHTKVSGAKISDITLSHCIFNNIQWGISLGECITFRGCTNCLIEYNTLTKCYKIGINPSDTDYTVVDHNTIDCSYMKQTSDGADSLGIYIDGGQLDGCHSSYVTVSNNYVYGSGQTMGLIGYCNEKGATIYMDHLTIVNNVLYTTGSGQIGIVSFHNAGYPKNQYRDIIVKHNTIYTPNGMCIRSGLDEGYVSNCVIANNILYGRTAISVDAPSETTKTHNLVTNPLFVSVGTNFHLQSSSPARDAASSTYSTPYDFDGKARTTPYDIGAYEYDGQDSGNSDSSDSSTSSDSSNSSTSSDASIPVPPVISQVTITNSSTDLIVAGYGWENVTCVVTDTDEVSTVRFQLTNPDKSTTNVSMIKKTGTTTYYANLSCHQQGEYDYCIQATDTSDNVAVSSSRTFWLQPDWDIDNDGMCNIRDLVLVSNHYDEVGFKGWIREDVDHNGVIQGLDLTIVSNHIGRSWWS